MNVNMHSQNEQSLSIIATIRDHPFLVALFFFVSCCVFTRVKTGFQARYNNVTTVSGATRSVPIAPYWIPFLGHTFEYGADPIVCMMKYAYGAPTGIFGVRVAGDTHNIVVTPSISKELLSRPNLALDVSAFHWRFLTYVMGDQGFYQDWHAKDAKTVDSITDVIRGLMREPYLGDATSKMVKLVEERAWNLLTGTPSWVDHSRWERAGQVEIVSTLPDGRFVAEADLFGLIRNFVGDIATTSLMGSAFLENNPNALDDLWLWDNKLTLMMSGIPHWLIPGMYPAVGARERISKAIEEHHRALMDQMEGKDSGYKYPDLSDVSKLIYDRTSGFHKANTPGRQYGLGDHTLYWALNVNANQVLFWLVYYIYQIPDLVRELREEIAPYVHLQESESKGLPIKEAPQLRFDVESLCHKCPILKSVFLETMRLEVGSMSYRVLLDDVMVSESKEDALRVGKSHPEKFHLRKGDLLCVSTQVHQRDSRYYQSPNKFDHQRFWKMRRNEDGEEQLSVEYGEMQPWGRGKTMCKGRAFAEREVVVLAAAILTLWDIDAVGGKAGWKYPGHKTTAGTMVPLKDIRVKIQRRKL